jgi:hypothetical protein
MQDTPIQNDHDFQAGYAYVMHFAQQAQKHGWRLSDRQLIHEIVQRERTAQIREKSSLPIIGQEVHSAAFHRGQASALRAILREQREKG